MSQAELDRQVLEHLAGKLFSMARVQEIVRHMVRAVASARAAGRGKVEGLRRQIDELEAIVRKYLVAFESGTMDPTDAGDRVKELRLQQEPLKRQLEALTRSHQVPPYVHTTAFLKRFHANLTRAFLSDTNGMAQRYVRLFVSRIVMTGNEVTIQANTAALFGAACEAATKRGTAVELTAVPTVDLSWLPGADSNHQPTG